MFRSSLLAAALTASLSGAVQATPWTDTYTYTLLFGDSLSDQGRAFAASGAVPSPPGPGVPFFPPPQPFGPYSPGRFTNGPNYVDLLQANNGLVTGANFANYAFGGATAVTRPGNPIADLGEQVGEFLSSGVPVGSRALALFFFGGNDSFGAAFQAAATFPDAAAIDQVRAAGVAAANVVRDNVLLFDGLLQDIALLNLGDPGRTPRFSLPNFVGVAPPVEQPAPAAGRQLGFLASAFAQAYNARLLEVSEELRSVGFRVTDIDVASALDDYLDNAASFGVTNTTQPCGSLVTFLLGFPVHDFSDDTCDETDPASVNASAWLDDVHLTARGHKVLAGIVQSAVPIPLPATGLLFGAGLVLLAGLRHHARAAPGAVSRGAKPT